MSKILNLKQAVSFFRNSVWAFPLVLTVLLFLLTVFKIHGSSIGMYNSILFGANNSDSSLLAGRPRAIRSDEWLGWTPNTVLQHKTNYPSFNQKLGSGRDVVFLADAPSRNWVNIFRPHNWGFFVLPFENAFSLRWWFGPYLLINALYFLLLRILNRKKTLAILLSIAFFLSPFLFWWHQPALFLAFAYSIIIMIFGSKIIDKDKLSFMKSERATTASYMVVLTYVLICLPFLIYAPFIISASLVTGFYLIGYLLEKWISQKALDKTKLLRILLIFFVCLSIAVTLVALAVWQHWTTIQTVGNSEYPGQRVVGSGEMPFPPIMQILGGFLTPLLQIGSRASGYFSNQSEASNFILLLPFLIIPGAFLQVREWVKYRKTDFIFLSLNILSIMIILRISVPIGDFFYKFMLLDKVPNNRLVAGLGLVGIIQLAYLIKHVASSKIKSTSLSLMATAYGFATLSVLFLFGSFVMNEYPKFLDNDYLLLIFFGTAFCSIITAFLANKAILGTSLLLIFGFFSVAAVNPIYRGLDFVFKSAIVNKIEAISSENDSWVVLDNLQFESLPYLAGRRTIGGPQIYTDIEFWKQLDRSGENKVVYNRQAHAIFVSNTQQKDPKQKYNLNTINKDLELVKGNLFKVRFFCGDFVYKNVDYVISLNEVDLPCLSKIDTVVYPKASIQIYKVSPITN